MTSKNYTIKKREISPDCIKFELDGYVNFGNGICNFILCPNEFPFKNYLIGDVIEVNLTDDKHITVGKVSKSMPEDMGIDDSSQLDEEENSNKNLGLTSAQEQLSAYDRKTVHKLFRISLEWLEKYIEVAYPNYKIRKQIHDNNVRRQDANDPNKVEGLFTGSLFGFKATIEMTGRPKFLYDEVKQEYYKWLDAAGVDINNCPPRLKHFLFEVNEVLEGRGDKLEKDIENRRWEIDPNSREYEEAVNKVFSSIQAPLEDEREEYANLKGKTHKDIKIENNFGDSGEKAEQAFKQMAGQHDYQGLDFLPQKKRNPNYSSLRDDPSEQFLSSSSPAGSSNVIQPSNSQSNIPHLTGQEIKDDYVEVRNEGQLTLEQLGEIQRVEKDLINSDVPLNTAMPVANGLAFVLVSSGILWFKSRFRDR